MGQDRTIKHDAFSSPTKAIALVQRALWVVIPIAVLAGLETTARCLNFGSRWYTGIKRLAEESPIDVMLIGTSRVPAAVDPDIFTELIREVVGPDPHVVMPARGWVTLIGHTLGVSQLFLDYNASLRGCDVLLELPDGLPPLRQTWSDLDQGWMGRWTYKDRSPQLLAEVLGPGDLPGLWRSQTDLELKIPLTLRCLAGPTALVRYRELLRNRVFSLGRRLVREQIVERFVDIRSQQALPEADLAARGGIKRDRKTVERARARIQRGVRELLANQVPIRDWDKTVLRTLADVVQQNGGRLVFFEIPQSSVLSALSQTDIRRQDRAIFRDWAARRGIPILKPDFTAVDEDFPDLLHLSASRSPAFTKALVRAWLNSR